MIYREIVRLVRGNGPVRFFAEVRALRRSLLLPGGQAVIRIIYVLPIRGGGLRDSFHGNVLRAEPARGAIGRKKQRGN